MKTKNTLITTVAMFATIGLNGAPITIDTVIVGNAGNTADSTGYGSVVYEYHITTTEITNTQYAAFLNAVAQSDSKGLYNEKMADIGSIGAYGSGIIRNGTDGNYTYTVVSGRENYAVNYVSLFDAARFCNWLTTGDTERGVYVIIDPSTLHAGDGSIIRDTSAWFNGGIVLPTEDEWYKAAYYNGDGTYNLYPTNSNNIGAGDANYAWGSGQLNDLTNVDFGGLLSPYGTLGQGGNVWEWNETVVSGKFGIRGGSFWDDESLLESSARYNTAAADEDGELNFVGFRVSSLGAIEIPEPSTYAALFGALALTFAVYRRRSFVGKK